VKKDKFILILILVGFLVYFNSLFNGFVWDDEEQIVNNPLVHSLSNLPQLFRGSTFNPGGAVSLGGIYYKPLMTVFFSLIYSIFGPRPFFFHLFQIVLHIINSILVFLVLGYLFNLKKKEKNDESLPFFLSLIFLIHPQNCEAVVYISALQDVVFFFFGMLALFMIIKTNKSQIFTASTNFVSLYGLASLFLFLSLLSKETGIVFFVIIFFYLLFFKKREDLPVYLVFSLTVICFYAVLRFGLAGIPIQKHGLSPITRMDFWQRMISVPQIIFYYLKTFFFPKNLAINQHWVTEKIIWSEFWSPLLIDSLFFLVLIGFFLFLTIKQFNNLTIIFSFFFLWFIFSLGFHLHIFPLDLTVSDRWFYLPGAGVLGMIGAVAPKLKIKNEKLKIIIVITIIILLSWRTFIRTFDWRNGLTLYSRDIKISQNAFDLENNLGVELFRVGRINEANIHFENSIKLAPYWWTNWNNLGVIYERKGDFKKAEEYYKKAIDNGNYYLAYENYAGILIKQKKNKEAKEFLEKEALPKLPYNQKLRQLYLFLTSSGRQN